MEISGIPCQQKYFRGHLSGLPQFLSLKRFGSLGNLAIFLKNEN